MVEINKTYKTLVAKPFHFISFYLTSITATTVTLGQVMTFTTSFPKILLPRPKGFDERSPLGTPRRR
jgi:TRAP-type mannitol/chloroaromatic compound transport system permease large subunit